MKSGMARSRSQNASLVSLAVWLAVWALFLAAALSSFDVRVIPGIGPLLLAALAASFLAPLVALGFAVGALTRNPRATLNWVLLACAAAAILGQSLLFATSRWL
jgi:hypothetical protein